MKWTEPNNASAYRIYVSSLTHFYSSEETAEDLRAHMHAIQENEFSQLKDLGSFLDLEINFVQHYFDVLREVKSEWPEKSVL